MVTSPQAFALAEHNAPSQSWYQRCQEFVRTALGLGPGSESAAAGYKANAARGTIYAGRTPAANLPVYFDTGPAGMGATATDWDHVALSAGGGMVWSNDIERFGQIDLVPISEIESRWGATYEGFGTYVNGTALPVLDASGNPASPSNPVFQNVGLGDLGGKLPGPLGDAAGAVGGLADDAAGALAGKAKDAKDAAQRAAEAIASAPARWVEEHIVEPGWIKLRNGATYGAFVVLGVGLVWAGAASLAKSGARATLAEATG